MMSLQTASMAPLAPEFTPETAFTTRNASSRSQTATAASRLYSVCAASMAADTTFTEQHASSRPGPLPIGPPNSRTSRSQQSIPVRRSRRIRLQQPQQCCNGAAMAAAIVEPSTLVDHPVASGEARNQSTSTTAKVHRPTLPTLKLDTSYTNPSTNSTATDFELAQFLSPVAPIHNQASTVSSKYNDTYSRQQHADLLAQVFGQQQQDTKETNTTSAASVDELLFNALGFDLATMPFDVSANGHVSLLNKDENDISQYLNDFFSTLPSAPVMAPSMPTSVPMSNAFQSLSPVESTYATPFAFDEPAPSDTPALVPDDEMLSALTSPMWADMSLFPAMNMPSLAMEKQQQQQQVQTISPIELSKPLQSFEDDDQDNIPVWHQAEQQEQIRPAATPIQRPVEVKRALSGSPAFDLDLSSSDAFAVPTVPLPAATAATSSGKRKRSSVTPSASSESSSARASFTGTRHSGIPLLDAEAPTQKRVYHGPPSKTSKRAVPASAARKVAALQQVAATGAVDAEEVEQEIEKSIEDKRRQNTVAARRSRMRKAEHLAGLEEQVRNLTEVTERLRDEMEIWRQRALQAGWRE